MPHLSTAFEVGPGSDALVLRDVPKARLTHVRSVGSGHVLSRSFESHEQSGRRMNPDLESVEVNLFSRSFLPRN
jgi:hypothetical protein